MALVTNSAEGGSNSVTVTTGNSGGASGTAFASVNAGITFSSAQKAHGSLAYAFAGTAATFNTVRLDSADGTTSGFSLRAYVYLTGYPSAETAFMQVQTGAGTNMASLNLSAAGKLRLMRSGGSYTGQEFTNAIPLNTWTRVTFRGTVSATATLNAAIYPGDSATATETRQATSQNVGTTAGGRVVYGKLTQTPSIATYYIDDIAQDLTSSVEIGPATVDHTLTPSSTIDLSDQASTHLSARWPVSRHILIG